jgi:hypothetical protein
LPIFDQLVVLSILSQECTHWLRAAYLDANAGNNLPNPHPIRKEVARIVDGAVTELKFYLADVEAFVAPLADDWRQA